MPFQILKVLLELIFEISKTRVAGGNIADGKLPLERALCRGFGRLLHGGSDALHNIASFSAQELISESVKSFSRFFAAR